jgi:hypothetical protein
LGAKQENNEMQNAYLSSPPMPRSCKSGKRDIILRLDIKMTCLFEGQTVFQLFIEGDENFKSWL